MTKLVFRGCIKTYTAPLILLLTVAPVFAQKKIPVNQQGEIINNSLDSLVKIRQYELVSAFDTVSKKPLLVYAQYRKNGHFGILDISGTEVTPAIYQSIPGLDRGITPNLFAYPKNYVVQEKGQYGLITNTGKVLIPATYERLYQRSRDSLHYTVIAGDQEWTIDAKGRKVLLPPEKDPWAQATAEREPDQVLSADGKTYQLNYHWTNKKTTVPNLGAVVHNYEHTVVFKNDLGKTGLYDVNKRKLAIPFEYDEIDLTYPGYYRVRKSDRKGIADSTGKVVIPLIYEHIGVTSGGINAYADSKYTIYDQKMRLLSETKFDGIMYSGQKGIIVKKEGKYGLMSIDGKTQTAIEYESMEVPEDHDLKFTIIIAKKNGKYGVMDFAGKSYTDFIYDKIVPESLVFSESRSLEPVFNGYANQPNLYYYVQKNGKWGLLDNDFKTMIAPSYEYFLESYDRTVLFARQNGKWGMIETRTQKPLIPLIYDGPLEYKAGNYQVMQGNQYGLMNREGKYLVPLQSSTIDAELIYKGLWKLSNYKERSFYFIDYSGRKSLPVSKAP